MWRERDRERENEGGGDVLGIRFGVSTYVGATGLMVCTYMITYIHTYDNSG